MRASVTGRRHRDDALGRPSPRKAAAARHAAVRILRLADDALIVIVIAHAEEAAETVDLVVLISARG